WLGSLPLWSSPRARPVTRPSLPPKPEADDMAGPRRCRAGTRALAAAAAACLAALCCAASRGFAPAPGAGEAARAPRPVSGATAPAPEAAEGAPAAAKAALALGAAGALALAAARPAGAGRRGPRVARGLLPPEDQKGYVGNALGYVTLWTNFMLGFFGSLYGGIVREMARPGPLKFIIPILAISIITFLDLRHPPAHDQQPHLLSAARGPSHLVFFSLSRSLCFSLDVPLPSCCRRSHSNLYSAALFASACCACIVPAVV
ncbi:unnamed protein product, partial [Prorocentrum cordatum]